MITETYSLPFCCALRRDRLFQVVGGLRKVRWSLGARGKRGGLRVIYYWDKPKECIYMLLVYPKSRQEDLTQEQLRSLRKLVKENLK
jgi:hypothetical protein